MTSLPRNQVDSVFGAADIWDEVANQPELPEPESDPSQELVSLLSVIQSPEFKTRFQAALDRLAGHGQLSYEANAQLVGNINSMALALGVKLQLRDSEQRVRLRCLNPPRSKVGCIQARTADRQQKVVYSGRVLPALIVE